MVELVHLVRHGEVDNPRRLIYADLPGFGLSERGWREAAAAADYLAGRPIAAVVTSPLQRARETASAIAERSGVAVVVDERLTEFLLARRWAGVEWDRLPEMFPGEVEAYLSHPHDMPFSPESIADLGRRVAAAVSAAVAEHTTEVVIVSHQDPIHAGRLQLTDLGLDRLLLDRPGHCDVITLAPGNPYRELSHWKPQLEGLPPPPEWPPMSKD